MGSFARRTAKLFSLVAAGVLWAGTVSVLVGPRLFDWIEAACGRALDYEQAVRLYILLALGLFLAAWLAFILRRLTAVRLLVWLLVAAGSGVIAAVCWFDQRFVLHHEASWIRYTTAAFLVLASLAAAGMMRWYRQEPDQGRWSLFWGFLSIAFLGLGYDELLMFHEWLGKNLESPWSSTALFADSITLGYAVVAILAGAVFFRWLAGEYLPKHGRFLQLFALAVCIFAVSQIFDTFDYVVLNWLRALARDPSHLEGFYFSDLWYVLWAPIQTLNDVEEVFENLAAVLFFAGIAILLVEKHRPDRVGAELLAKPKTGGLALGVLVSVSLAAAVWGARGQAIDSATIDGPATPVARERDGLSHTDLVFFHPAWGLLIANEGKANVLIFRDGVLRSLPDPEKLLQDVDAVTATTDTVYVSDPILAIVFAYTEEAGWRPFLTGDDGILKPEGLVVVDSTMYVLDEDYRRIYVIDVPSREVATWILEDDRWASPEAVAYHPELGELLISDDTSGYLMAVRPGGTARVFASPEDGLLQPCDVEVTGDNRIFVADRGSRQVIELAADGRVVHRIRFHRMYGDLAGVAVVPGETGDRLYVSTSDGYGSKSFMPSTVWQLPLPAPEPGDSQPVQSRASATTAGGAR